MSLQTGPGAPAWLDAGKLVQAGVTVGVNVGVLVAHGPVAYRSVSVWKLESRFW